MQLDGKRIIVTGGANGIAAATVHAYAREGARVAVLDVEDQRGREVAAEAGASYHHCDIAKHAEVSSVFDRVAAELGGLDVLANVAAVEQNKPAELLDEADLDRMLGVNLKGTIFTNQAAFRLMQKSGGRIINFGSGSGVRGQRGAAHYSASKGAVMSWTRTVAQEWARYGITVNAVIPAIWTRMYDAYRQNLPADQLKMHDMIMQMNIPLGGRLGDADRDIAPVMIFLASDGPRFMTGQCLAVDGGMVMLGA